MPDFGVQYQEVCICKSHSPISAFSATTGDILVFRLLCSFVYILIGSKLISLGKRNAGYWDLPDLKRNLFCIAAFCTPINSPLACHILFSITDITMCTFMTSLRIDTGQALASLIKWKVRHTNNQSSSWMKVQTLCIRRGCAQNLLNP